MIKTKTKNKKQKTDLHVCRVGVRGGQLAIYLISKVNKRSNGSDVRWKAIPQMCPTVAETTFQKIGTGLRQSQFVLISLFLSPWSVLNGLNRLFRYSGD